MKKFSDLRFVILVFVLIILFALWISRPASRRIDASRYEISTVRTASVGLVEVIGPICDARKWCKQIDDFRKNRQVKAIVIRMDSPGGGVSAAQELYTALKRARAVKPVVVSMGGVAASGGYYSSLGADTIVANPGTTTGSIGVLIEVAQLHELMEKIGFSTEVIKSGEYKDSGTPFRKLSPKERTYLQGYVDDAYDQFIQVVAEERSLDLEKVKEIADGRVFTGRQALALGLVDVLGDQYDAVCIAAKMAGLGAEPNIVKPPKKLKGWDWVDYVLDELEESLRQRLESRPMFQYIWQPGEL